MPLEARERNARWQRFSASWSHDGDGARRLHPAWERGGELLQNLGGFAGALHVVEAGAEAGRSSGAKWPDGPRPARAGGRGGGPRAWGPRGHAGAGGAHHGGRRGPGLRRAAGDIPSRRHAPRGTEQPRRRHHQPGDRPERDIRAGAPSAGARRLRFAERGLGHRRARPSRPARRGASSFVSMGAKADLSGNETVPGWEQEPATGVVYLESFGNPRHFGRISRRVAAGERSSPSRADARPGRLSRDGRPARCSAQRTPPSTRCFAMRA